MSVPFKVGDRVVYPNHGIGVIEAIQNREIGGNNCSFFSLKIVANDTTVLIPTQNASNVGLRKTITRRDVDSLFELLKDDQKAGQSNWKGRFKENSDRMRSGSIFEVAEVLKALSFLSRSKTLSYREKRMLDKARQLVVMEVAEVQRTPVEQVEVEVETALTNLAMADRAHRGH